MFNEKINEIQIALGTVTLNQAVSLEIVMTASKQKKEREKNAGLSDMITGHHIHSRNYNFIPNHLR